MASKQDQHRAAVEAHDEIKEAWRENHGRMLDDLRFSNPADPQQWDAEAQTLRKGRIMHTHDRTNQYKQAVVNQARKNKPAILTSPADSRGDVEVAKRIDGIIRHIEYSSRAHIAYDTAIGHAADCGIGWIRVTPRIVKQHSNQQEWKIERVIDPLSIVCDGTEPDGSDMTQAFAETLITKKQFKADFPKADPSSWGDSPLWDAGENMIRICERQFVVDEPETWVSIASPESGEEIDLSVKDYRELVEGIGYSPPIIREWQASKRRVMWQKLSAYEVLEETEFPSTWIGMVPVIGYETFIDGKRFLCGLTRRLRPGQIDYNFQRSAGTEAVALQPKAPLMAAMEAMDGHADHYAKMNNGSPAVLPWNAFDEEGRPVPMPSRLQPPTLPTAYLQGAQQALSDMEAAIGMLRSSGDAPPASASGRALRERANAADTATFHFPDNQSNSIEQIGRIIVSGLPRIYDTKRIARIIGEEAKHDSVMVDPEMEQPVARKNGKIVAVNFGIGEYDVRIKTGPSYTSQRESAAEGIEQILSAAPQFTAVLGPQLVKLRDFPDADKTARMMVATLPPEMQAIFNEGNENDPEAKDQEIQALKQQLQQAQQQMQQMGEMGQQQLAQLQEVSQENEAIKADQSVKGIEVQIKAKELELKERELAIKEQDAQLRVMESQAKAAQSNDIEAANLELQAQRDQVEAFRAETERMRMEQDSLIAEREAQMQAALALAEQAKDTQEAERISALESELAGMKSLLETLAQKLMADEEDDEEEAPAIVLQISPDVLP